MTDLSGVETPAPLQEPVPVNTTDTTGTTAAQTISGTGGLSQLPKALVDAISYAIAQHICRESQASTDRIKKILAESERQ